MTLDDVAVVTVRKSFWASGEASAFPRRIYAHVLYGHSTNLVNSLFVFVRAIVAFVLRPPRVVLLGSVERTVPWFIQARRVGLLRGAKLVVTNQLHLTDDQLAQVDRVVLYSRPLIESARPALRSRGVFLPLPADGDFAEAARRAQPGEYVFAGGGAGRDFPSLIAALAGADVTLRIVTFSRETLAWHGELPPNVSVEWRMELPEFLARMAGAQVVVVPLRDSESPHGQVSIVQALALGKPVVATRSFGVDDYVRDSVEGFLVDAGDVDGYREAVLRIVGDVALRERLAEAARRRAQLLTYESFGDGLAEVVSDVARGSGG